MADISYRRKQQELNNAAKWDLIKASAMLTGLAVSVTGHSLIVHYSRRLPGPQYHVSTTVLLSEIVKLVFAAIMVFREENWSFPSYCDKLKQEVVQKPSEVMKVSIASFIYAVQNNLNFVGMSNLDSATYQVTSQLKILTTAVFMKVLLGKRFSRRQKIALGILCIGETLVHWNNNPSGDQNEVQEVNLQEDGGGEGGSKYPHKGRSMLGLTRRIVESVEDQEISGLFHASFVNGGSMNEELRPFMGLVAVGTACLTSGFAGVYFELVLKHAPVSCTFWLRNFQLYLCGTVASGVTLLLSQGSSVRESGFFYGYSPLVLLVTVSSAMTGLLVSIVICRLSNIWKSFSTAMAVVLTSAASMALFGKTLDSHFLFGSFLVIMAPCVYAAG